MTGDYNGWMDVPESEREALDIAWLAIDSASALPAGPTLFRGADRRRWPRP